MTKMKIKCLKDYSVKVGDGAEPEDFKAGKTYEVSERTAMHLLRKTYNMHEERNGRRVYIGDGSYFEDPAAVAAAKEAEAKDAKGKAKADAKAEADK